MTARLLSPQRATMIVAAMATFMTLMDTQIVNVALASITRDFHSSTASTQWLVSGYSLSLAAAMPASGWFGDRFGSKRVMTCAIVTFTGGSALCAMAPSVPLLLAARVLQGLGGGVLIPVSLTAMHRAYPLKDRIGATKAMTMIYMVAPATAPLIGGLILTGASWRWIFLINLPVGLLVLVIIARYFGEQRESVSRRLDIPGLILGPGGVALLLYAVSDGPVSGWGNPLVWATGACGILMLLAFVWVELAESAPLLRIRLLVHERLFADCTLLQFLQPMVFGASLLFTSLYIQESRGLSPLISGTTTCPEAIGIVCASPLVARLYPRMGPRRLTAVGFLLLATGTALLAHAGADTNLWLIRSWTFLLGVGTAFVALSIRTAAFAQIDPEHNGDASAIFNTGQRVGQAVGVAALASILTVAAGTSLRPQPSDFTPVFLSATAIGLLGFVLCVRLNDNAARATMVKAE